MPKPKKRIKPRVTGDWRKLVEAIETGNEVEVVEAAKELAYLRLRSSVKPLVRLFKEGRTPHVRESAGYALAWMDLPDLNRVFIKCLLNKKESGVVRGQAAEALEILHSNGRSQSRRYQIAEDALLTSLSDPSPTVRFWCCFALGGMDSKRAVEPLSRLKRFDRALCPGWWYVREEASDALDRIQGRISPDRVPVHRRPKTRK
jgi:HEAT repeat protein